MRLALFDLDHTLIPFDSGMAWTRFLIARGVLPASAESDYLLHARAYVAGVFDIHAVHRDMLAPLARHEPEQLQAWARDFEASLTLPIDMQALVKRHQDAGDLCAIVTATTRLVAAPLARRFGIAELLCTEAELEAGRPTGAIHGQPCYREHKVTHVTEWLQGRSLQLADCERSWFYSDSASDLPLLQAVTDPVAVRPDPILRAHAERAGWMIFE